MIQLTSRTETALIFDSIEDLELFASIITKFKKKSQTIGFKKDLDPDEKDLIEEIYNVITAK